MIARSRPVISFGSGIVVGAVLFFLSYWWLGALTVSVLVGLLAGGLVAAVTRPGTRPTASRR